LSEIKQTIDLNCDMGEGMENEFRLMPFISSANIACGFHAGDEATMRRIIRLCVQHRVAIGAHPSFPDRPNFGRVNMNLPAGQVKDMVSDQIRLLMRLCQEEGATLRHVKPHGALYNMAAVDLNLANAICAAIIEIDPGLILFGLSGSIMADAARSHGITFYHETFSDRTYRHDGTLTPRSMPDALIINPEQSAEQALNLAQGSGIDAEGKKIFPKADTICLHGDGPDAVAFASSIFSVLRNNKIVIGHE
jgi:UPF0271 protein